MSDEKWTSGEWSIEFGEGIKIRAPDNGAIASLGMLKERFGSLGRRDDNEVRANAHLIAASPDMAKALAAIRITPPDGDGTVWLAINAGGLHALIRVGEADRIPSIVVRAAQAFEGMRSAALAAARGEQA
jgi:hypothetical protein